MNLKTFLQHAGQRNTPVRCVRKMRSRKFVIWDGIRMRMSYRLFDYLEDSGIDNVSSEVEVISINPDVDCPTFFNRSKG